MSRNVTDLQVHMEITSSLFNKLFWTLYLKNPFTLDLFLHLSLNSKNKNKKKQSVWPD